MHFASYVYNEKKDYGILNKAKNQIVPMKKLLKKLQKDVPENLLKFIQIYSNDLTIEINKILENNGTRGIPLEEVKLLAPIPYPRRNLFCLGKNYIGHVQEISKDALKEQADIPKYPIYFSKVADPAIGNGDQIIMSQGTNIDLDYEVELAVIISKDGKNIPLEKTEDYIFGYTICNDITSRSYQTKHSQWFKGKSMDTFSSIGPYITHKTNIEYPPKLDIICKVNNEVRQSSNTEQLIFDIPYIISDLSDGLMLRAGDIILTGTPAGVGMGFSPPRYLKKGDIVECYIEKLGKLINYID